MREGAVSLVDNRDASWLWELDRQPLTEEIMHANKLFDAMEVVVGRMALIKENITETRTGGLMIVSDGVESGQAFTLIRPVGELKSDTARTAAEKNKKYTRVAFGKFRSLLENPGFISSAQNVTDLTPEKQIVIDGLIIPGGAVRFPDKSICVLSGFGTPEEDECAVLAAKVVAGDMTRDQAAHYARLIGNTSFLTHMDYLTGDESPRVKSLRENKRFVNRKYGDNKFIDDVFFQLLEAGDYETLADMLGWSHACPVVPDVIKRGGFRTAVETYAELILLSGSALDIIRKHNVDLYAEFSGVHKRKKGEKPGKYYRGYTPPDHMEIIRGVAMASGYILPRLIREYLGERADRTPAKFVKAFNILERVVKNGLKRKHPLTPEQLVVDLAVAFDRDDRKSNGQSDPLKYIRRLFSEGKLNEDHQYGEYKAISGFMRKFKPDMWGRYQSVSGETLKKKGIADMRSSRIIS